MTVYESKVTLPESGEELPISSGHLELPSFSYKLCVGVLRGQGAKLRSEFELHLAPEEMGVITLTELAVVKHGLISGSDLVLPRGYRGRPEMYVYLAGREALLFEPQFAYKLMQVHLWRSNCQVCTDDLK